jgi:signal transduction histidine kinase
MNIALIGGGNKCGILLELIRSHKFRNMNPKILAVADKDDSAPGMVKAKEMGIYTTNDYNELFDNDEIDLIVELTGKQDVFLDVINKKKKTVRSLDSKTAMLFWEMSSILSEQKVTEKLLHETRAIYGVLINELIQYDVMVIAPGFHIQDINNFMLKKHNITKEEAIGKYCYEISHGQDRPCQGKNHPCPLIQTLKTQQPARMTHVHLDDENREVFYSLTTYPLVENGKMAAVVEIWRDITKDINLQRLMMHQEKLASIGRLAAGVAHEINNPMTTILTSAMLIQEDMNPEDPNYEELQTIADETKRCSRIVKSLLDFARHSKPSITENSINDIVREGITLTKKQAKFNDVSIEENLTEDLPPVYVDKDQIEQVVINLSQNAIEATPPGGKITFTTRLGAKKGTIEIVVSDTGKGIPKEDQRKIFEPFYTTKESGTGLGMAITVGHVHQHGGIINVESSPGNGSTFVVRLPIKKEDNNG